MKNVIYFIIFFTFGQWLYAQTGSDSSYYPLDIGNLWQNTIKVGIQIMNI